MVSQIYPIKIKPQLNKANTFDTEAVFSNLTSFLDECFSFPSYDL